MLTWPYKDKKEKETSKSRLRYTFHVNSCKNKTPTPCFYTKDLRHLHNAPCKALKTTRPFSCKGTAGIPPMRLIQEKRDTIVDIKKRHVRLKEGEDSKSNKKDHPSYVCSWISYKHGQITFGLTVWGEQKLNWANRI